MKLTADQAIVFATLGATLVLFVIGRWRYDLVALAALMALALTGAIKPNKVFTGFSDSAVISVAAVLIMSRGLRNSGVVEVLAERLAALSESFGQSLRIALLGAVVSFLSAFINDVGTLALFMPVVTKLARKQKMPAGRILMPLAYCTLLGGMTTLVGAPVNLIISAYRAGIAGSGFSMFAFTPVGAGIAFVGLLFLAIVGWRLMPAGETDDDSGELFKVENYLTEVRVTEKSKVAGKTIQEVETSADGAISVISLLRNGWRQVVRSGVEPLQINDILLIRGDPEGLEAAIAKTGLELEAQKQAEAEQETEARRAQDDQVQTVEAVVVPGAWLAGRSAHDLRLRDRYGINILAVAQRGAAPVHQRLRNIYTAVRGSVPARQRLHDIRFEAGDVLLTQGESGALQHAFSDLGCLPLAHRDIRIGHPRRALLAFSIFVAALAAAALNLFSVPVCLTAGAVAMLVLGLLPLDEAYASLEGPVLVLIAAMIAAAGALHTSGGSALLARPLLAVARHAPGRGAVALIYVVTMLVSNTTNYVSTAVLMAPIAQDVAAGLDVGVDPFLMAVAFGSVSAFMTPIGHPSNTLVMGPGRYNFIDYVRMGVPISILTTLTAAVLIPHFWPLRG
jgi:di/tricarboxylate transporter